MKWDYCITGTAEAETWDGAMRVVWDTLAGKCDPDDFALRLSPAQPDAANDD